MAESIVGSWPLEVADPRAPSGRRPVEAVRAAVVVAALAGAVAGGLAGTVLTALATEPPPRVARVSPVVERAVTTVEWTGEPARRISAGGIRFDSMYGPR